MKSHARAVIIGGGIAGCSTLYHLTQQGWRDVVLVERDELTSGSTWHAAAQVTQFGVNQTMVALKRHSIDLYRELAADDEHPINYHITGGMRLAHTQGQVDTYQHYIGMAAGVGVDFEYIDPAEAARRHPLLNTDGLLGAWWDPLDGDIDPAQLTFALARRARHAGAEVYRRNPVESISRSQSGEFIVHTQDGDIVCEVVVNAAGYRVNEIGRMLGVVHPVISMEHMYFLTEPLAPLQARQQRVPIIRDPADDFYSRQEKQGLLVGIYEQRCHTFGIDGVDANFSQALCPSDLDRCLDNMERIFERLPVLQEAGIHTVINGPITYSADGAPLVGPIPGVTNAFACIGLRAGIGEGGGLGHVLAQIIVNGECEWDAWYLDPRRFSGYANVEHTALKAIEEYQREFHYPLPREHRPAARPARSTPLYPVLDQLNPVWGEVNGWERALCFKPDKDFIARPSYRFNDTDRIVAAEVNAVASGVGIMEVSGFNRIEITGRDSSAFLDRLICGALPRTVGQVRLCYLLNPHGNILAEATIAKLGEHHYWYGSAAASECHDYDWLHAHLPPDGVSLTPLTDRYTALIVAGPRSRELLASAVDRRHGELAIEQLRWMRTTKAFIGHAEATVLSVSYSGELAFELHLPNEQLYPAWQRLSEVGATFGLRPFGLYAAESMRLEKGYRHWKADLLTEFNPIESGLERFVDNNKSDFIGKAALAVQRQQGLRKRFVTLTLDDDQAPAHSGDPVYRGDLQIGSVSSGGYGYRVDQNIALAFIDPATHAGTSGDADTRTLSVGILGQQVAAQLAPDCLYDPNNQRVNGPTL